MLVIFEEPFCSLEFSGGVSAHRYREQEDKKEETAVGAIKKLAKLHSLRTRIRPPGGIKLLARNNQPAYLDSKRKCILCVYRLTLF